VPQGCETACEFSVTIGALLLLLVALRALGGVWSACGGVVGSCGVVVMSAAGEMVVSLTEFFCYLLLVAAYDVY
jgi:hypothetical protein